jgi:H/ACA ribonucleoprotein complex subunit 3
VWVGPTFGFGFYRASAINVAFTFSATRAGINDMVKIPKISGQLIDATCVFTDKLCWFFSSSQESGRTINRCSMIRADGTVEAFAEAEASDNSWLTSIRGCAAIGKVLLVPTDKGVLQIKVDQGKLMIAKKYPDTEPFVSSETRLFAAADGLYAVGVQEITKLKIA